MALYTLAPQPWLILLDDSGVYVPNGQLAIYYAGTSTPATVFTSGSGVAHPFPITLDSAGRVPGALYLTPGQNYKFVLHQPMVEEPLDGAIIKSQDNIEAVPHSGGSTLAITVPGDYHLDVTSVDVIEYTGVGDMTIRGMSGGVQGQGLTIQNLSGYIVWLNTSDPTAGPGNTLVNLVSFGPMPLVGFRGNAHYTYLSGEWRMGTYEMGNPITPPYDATAYSAAGGAGGTWVVDPGDVVYENFLLAGRTVSYSFYITNTSVTGAPIYLTRRLPFGWNLLEGNTVSGILVMDNGAQFALAVALMYDARNVRFERVAIGTPWSASNQATAMIGRVEIVLA